MKRSVNRNPLRLITGHWTDERGITWERLECGHSVIPRSDIIGPTNALRRRCRHCGKTSVGAQVLDLMAALKTSLEKP